jgi:hypothetical protein
MHVGPTLARWLPTADAAEHAARRPSSNHSQGTAGPQRVITRLHDALHDAAPPDDGVEQPAPRLGGHVPPVPLERVQLAAAPAGA